MQLRRGETRQFEHCLNHQAITWTAVIKNVHQGGTWLFRGLAVVHHHLNPQGPQGYARRQGHQLGRPLRSAEQGCGKLQAIQHKAKSSPCHTGCHPSSQDQRIPDQRRLQRRQRGWRLQLAGFRTDRECGAEWEVPIEIAIHLRAHHEMVVKAIKKRPITGLRITPEVVEGLLVREAFQVIKSVAHRLGGHRMEQGLQAHRAVHSDHTTTRP